MKNNIVSHLKFTVKDGCVDDFLASVAKIDRDPLFATLRTFAVNGGVTTCHWGGVKVGHCVPRLGA